MRKLLNKMVKGQRGQILPTVLVVLLAGVLVIVPTLAVASTSIKSGAHFKADELQLYAADAGVEAAVAVLRNCYPNSPWGEDGIPPYIFSFKVRNNAIICSITDTETTYPPTYEIVSRATDNRGRFTEITTRVQARNTLFDYGALSIGKGLNCNNPNDYAIRIQPGGIVNGPIATSNDACLLDLDPNGISGEIDPNEVFNWPTKSGLHNYYLGLPPFTDGSPTGTNLPAQLDIQNYLYPPNLIGPGCNNGDMTIINGNTGKDTDVGRLNGTINGTSIYMSAQNKSLEIGTSGSPKDFVLDLNNTAIFSESTLNGPGKYAINVGGKCTLKGSGCIIAVGSINFQPKLVTQPEKSYIFLMSIEGDINFQPNGDFNGTVAGGVKVNLQPGNTLTWFDFTEVDLNDNGVIGPDDMLPYPYMTGSHFTYKIWIVNRGWE